MTADTARVGLRVPRRCRPPPVAGADSTAAGERYQAAIGGHTLATSSVRRAAGALVAPLPSCRRTWRRGFVHRRAGYYSWRSRRRQRRAARRGRRGGRQPCVQRGRACGGPGGRARRGDEHQRGGERGEPHPDAGQEVRGGQGEAGGRPSGDRAGRPARRRCHGRARTCRECRRCRPRDARRQIHRPDRVPARGTADRPAAPILSASAATAGGTLTQRAITLAPVPENSAADDHDLLDEREPRPADPTTARSRRDAMTYIPDHAAAANGGPRTVHPFRRSGAARQLRVQKARCDREGDLTTGCGDRHVTARTPGSPRARAAARWARLAAVTVRPLEGTGLGTWCWVMGASASTGFTGVPILTGRRTRRTSSGRRAGPRRRRGTDVRGRSTRPGSQRRTTAPAVRITRASTSIPVSSAPVKSSSTARSTRGRRSPAGPGRRWSERRPAQGVRQVGGEPVGDHRAVESDAERAAQLRVRLWRARTGTGLPWRQRGHHGAESTGVASPQPAAVSPAPTAYTGTASRRRRGTR